MKPKIAAIIASVAIIGALIIFAVRLSLMGNVSADDFNAFIREQEVANVGAMQTSAPSPMPFLISIRFPANDQKGGLGFPDRTDIYTFESDPGVYECHAHVRRGQVCLITFEGGEPSAEFRDALGRQFPMLSVR